MRERVGSRVRAVRRVKIRFVPLGNNDLDFSDEFIGADVSARSSPEPEEEHDHHHDQQHQNAVGTAISTRKTK